MVLEATIICIDNSDHVRNSDYLPTRLQAEADAINLLAGAKTQSNPENSVGVLSLAGSVPKVLVTPTDDLGQVLNSVHGISTEGAVNFSTGIQVAHLALKHRQNKHQRMRIVLFIGSPINTEHGELIAVGKKLKKCNVAVDVVSFGDVQKNAEKLSAFIEAVSKNGNSNLVTVPPGEILADVLLNTPIFLDEDSCNHGSGFAAAAAAAASQVALQGFNSTAGVNGEDDPALLMALRVSLEEERARQEAQAQTATDVNAPPTDTKVLTATIISDEEERTISPSSIGADSVLSDSVLLQQAFALSVEDTFHDDSVQDACVNEAEFKNDHRQANLHASEGKEKEAEDTQNKGDR